MAAGFETELDFRQDDHVCKLESGKLPLVRSQRLAGAARFPGSDQLGAGLRFILGYPGIGLLGSTCPLEAQQGVLHDHCFKAPLLWASC